MPRSLLYSVPPILLYGNPIACVSRGFAERRCAVGRSRVGLRACRGLPRSDPRSPGPGTPVGQAKDRDMPGPKHNNLCIIRLTAKYFDDSPRIRRQHSQQVQWPAIPTILTDTAVQPGIYMVSPEGNTAVSTSSSYASQVRLTSRALSHTLESKGETS